MYAKESAASTQGQLLTKPPENPATLSHLINNTVAA